MPKKKLTDLGVKRLKSPGKPQTDYWDSLTPGFGIRVTDKGRKSWVMMTRVFNQDKGKKTLARFTLGTYPAMNLAAARKAGAAKLDEVTQGNESGIDTRAKRPPPTLVKARTIEDAVAEFFRLYVKTNLRAGTAEQYRIAFDVHALPRWEGRTIDDIHRSDIITLLDEIVAAGTPIAANRTLSAISKFFNWAAPRYDLGMLPTLGVEKPSKEKSRERVLTDAELVLLWSATEKLGWPFGPFVRMLLITAQRRGEVAMMQWKHVDLDKAMWTIPQALTKADRTHAVPLSPLAVELLEDLPRIGKFVFTTTGDKPLSGFSRMKSRLGNLTGFTDWNIHDLRRTAGTNMAQLRIPTSTISKVLNHAEGGVTPIYVRHSFGPEKRDALGTWASKLESIVRPTDDNVVALRR